MRFDAKEDQKAMLNFEMRKEQNAFIVALSGNLDSLTTNEFTRLIETKLSEGEDFIIVNLDKLDHLSSAGLRGILLILKKITADGKKIYFVSTDEDVNRIFKTAGFYNSLINIYESEDAVLNLPH
ncbi:MAG: STAS domain-containing protein [Nitrospirae bacterium]|nr:STAS domain-containing protein [Nitrospirota bacterium]